MPAMRTSIRTLSLSLAVTLSLVAGGARLAEAQVRRHGAGLGVELPLTEQFFSEPSGWLSFVYDTGAFHFDLLGNFLNVEDQSTQFGVGARLYYTAHRSTAADFSLGGGLFVVHTSEDTTDRNFNDIGIELGPKIRFFMTPAVALHTTFGVAVFLADENGADELGLVGRLNGNFGVTYFFR